MANTVIVTLSGGSGMTTTGMTTITGGGTINVAPVVFQAQQIAGLVKMIPCNTEDCRVTPQIWCDYLPVFGIDIPGRAASYNNDYNSFLVNFSGNGTPGFVLQKAKSSGFDGKSEPLTWTTVANITNNMYGTYLPLGQVPGHPTYMQFVVNWGSVYASQGAGLYRILFQSCITTVTTGEMAQQAVAVGQMTPYALQGAQSWWSQVNKILVTISMQCGHTFYNVPPFYVGPASSAAEMTSMLAAVNGWFSAHNAPFLMVADPLNPTTNWWIQGTQFANQNGCIFNYTLDFYKSVGTALVQIPNSEWSSGSQMTGGVNGSSTTTVTCTCALMTPVFELLLWDCMRAHGTVKFEIVSSNTLGDVNNDGVLFDLCGLSLYDSVRIKGFFGYPKYTYEELLIEWGQSSLAQFGEIDRVRDKMIQGYTFQSNYLNAQMHKQLANVMMMAQVVLASDYNINNSDYQIMRKRVIKKGGYEPEYKKGKNFPLNLKTFERRDKVKVEFVAGIQSVIMSTCCVTAN